MNFIVVLCVILLKVVNCEIVAESYEDYVDPILYLLLNGNDTDVLELQEASDGELSVGDEAVLTDGTWTCGSCNNVDESKLIYSEVNTVSSNVSDDKFLQVQVGLSLEEMRCVTISSTDEFVVKRIAGSCTGPTLTLNVADAQAFTVSVYGN